jgi:hypothetical protein
MARMTSKTCHGNNKSIKMEEIVEMISKLTDQQIVAGNNMKLVLESMKLLSERVDMVSKRVENLESANETKSIQIQRLQQAVDELKQMQL